MSVKVNLKNGSSDILKCSSVIVEGLYLKIEDCEIDDLLGFTTCTRYYRLVNVMSYDILGE